MKPTDANDPLDALLQENDPYVEDNGFTARVIDALPPRRRRAWLRPAILLGAAIIGFAVMAWWLPSLTFIYNVDSTGAFTINVESLFTLAALLVVLASLSWGLFAAVEWED